MYYLNFFKRGEVSRPATTPSPATLIFNFKCWLRIDTRGLCLSLQETINTSATTALGRILSSPFVLTNSLSRGARLNVLFKTAVAMPCSFGGTWKRLPWATPYDVS